MVGGVSVPSGGVESVFSPVPVCGNGLVMMFGEGEEGSTQYVSHGVLDSFVQVT